ncbi:hypothetical protein LOZ58_005599 [Ophidiomyces ophidiicola]|nr:hypothetical protein LOZ65_005004 [Ophidiomyces ophidiicola]KAI1957515.1 hypothetical protein LOZ58_005599 [Ophidiomyces ophidiicola]
MRVIATLVCLAQLCGLARPVVAATDLTLPFLLSPSLPHLNLRRDALTQLAHDARWARRAPQPQQASPPRSTPPVNEQQFNETATAACVTALGRVRRAINPSGLAACYNIPFFNATTGTFAADIRLYQVSPPSGGFAGVPTSQYTLEMIIPSATVSSPNRLQSNVPTGPNSPMLLQDFRHIGRLDQLLQIEKLSLQDLRIILLPNITITTRSASNDSVSTALSSDTLSYVTGFLMNQDQSPNNITFPDAAAQLPAIMAAATKFVIPGVSLGIFPIGAIVTCIWSGLLILTVGLGTLQRMQFREHFRGRVRMDAARKRSGPTPKY